MAELRRICNRWGDGRAHQGLTSTIAVLLWPVLASTHAAAELSPTLKHALTRLEASQATRATARQLAGATPRIRLRDDGRLQLSLTLKSADNLRPEVEKLAALETKVQLLDVRRARAQVLAPFDRVREIDALPFVLRTDTPGYAFTSGAGHATSAGDALHGADEVRSHGVDGQGIRIGILSDGAAGLAQAQSSGDLPAVVRTFGNCTPVPFDGPACQFASTCAEGTALAEIVHDLAPGAEIAIGAVSTADEFTARLDELLDDFGADIIIDDINFYFEPFFEPSRATRAVKAAANRVLYVTAAGNGATGHHEAQFRPVDAGGAKRHDFGAAAGSRSEASLPIAIAARSLALVSLQWNDPVGGSSNDYDLFARVANGEALYCDEGCKSDAPQREAADPMEGMCLYNDSDRVASARLTIELFAGDARRLELFVLGDAVATRHNIASGSIIGHNGLPGVLTVGAVWEANPETLQPYSAHGPARMDFPTVTETPKPDLVAVDGVAVTGAGGFPVRFFGTSAAAPHVAAAAALLMQQFPDATDRDIRRALTRRAVDLGTPGTDLQSGAGRLDIMGALNFFATTDVRSLLPAILDLLLKD